MHIWWRMTGMYRVSVRKGKDYESYVKPVKQKWGIYQIRSSQEQKIDRYTFPIMGNGREESFAEKYQRKWNQQIRTKTELAHFIKGFGLEDYVRYQDCQVEDDFPGNRETYAVNCFIPDEIRLRSTQKKLVLYFQPGNRRGGCREIF